MTDDAEVECSECGGTVRDSARFSAEEWGVCASCWPDLSRGKRDSILEDLTDDDS